MQKMTIVRRLLVGTAIGSILSGVVEGCLFLLGAWNHPWITVGYHIHHSVFGVLVIVIGIVAAIRRFKSAWYLVGIGLGIIAMHTLTDGRFIFLEYGG
jgi:hypothetical protein